MRLRDPLARSKSNLQQITGGNFNCRLSRVQLSLLPSLGVVCVGGRENSSEEKKLSSNSICCDETNDLSHVWKLCSVKPEDRPRGRKNRKQFNIKSAAQRASRGACNKSATREIFFNQITRLELVMGTRRGEWILSRKIHFSCRVIHNFLPLSPPPPCLPFSLDSSEFSPLCAVG